MNRKDRLDLVTGAEITRQIVDGYGSLEAYVRDTGHPVAVLDADDHDCLIAVYVRELHTLPGRNYDSYIAVNRYTTR